MDTIFAQATAPGRAGVSIIRISGPDAFGISAQLCKVPAAGQFHLSALKDLDGNLVDRCLVLAFGHGASFTGEDVVELHLHGSKAIVGTVLSLLSEFPACRLADPGEFTRRALTNGNLDLTQVEALSDLIDADTETQRLQAMRVFDGDFGNVVNDWRADLLHSLALLEASIDFSDEEIPDNLALDVLALVHKTRTSIQDVLDQSKNAERVRDGFTVAIVGAPNVGKSTLLNSIAGREAAITSDIAGTTRDVIEVSIDINGLAVIFLDTAGIRDSDDQIESLGIELAKKRAADADLRLFLVDSPDDDFDVSRLPEDLVVLNKADKRDTGELSVSGTTGQGVRDLLNLIGEHFSKMVPVDVTTIRVRQSDGLVNASAALHRAGGVLTPDDVQYELASFEVRSALTALDFVLGKVDVEMVLSEIFSNFCLGK